MALALELDSDNSLEDKDISVQSDVMLMMIQMTLLTQTSHSGLTIQNANILYL
jgi:hypothetical protein